MPWPEQTPSCPGPVPGESLLLEIDQLAAPYGDNEAALAAATTVNGRRIDPGQIGAIVVGARADLLLSPDDPVKNLAALKHWRLLIADGRAYLRAKVDEWPATYDRHFRSRI